MRIPPIRLAEKENAAPVPMGKPFDIVSRTMRCWCSTSRPAGGAWRQRVSFGLIEQLRRPAAGGEVPRAGASPDRETSGLLIVAKKRSALTVLHDMMRDGKVQKRYLTLVAGRWLNAQQQ